MASDDATDDERVLMRAVELKHERDALASELAAAMRREAALIFGYRTIRQHATDSRIQAICDAALGDFDGE
jgi:hypothetical protein